VGVLRAVCSKRGRRKPASLFVALEGEAARVEDSAGDFGRVVRFSEFRLKRAAQAGKERGVRGDIAEPLAGEALACPKRCDDGAGDVRLCGHFVSPGQRDVREPRPQLGISAGIKEKAGSFVGGFAAVETGPCQRSGT